MGKLSKNFQLSEFECHCGCGLCKPHPKLIEHLQAMRDEVCKPIKVLSGTRCPKHNRAVGGALKSFHMVQKDGHSYAADIQIQGLTPKGIATIAKRLGFGGIIVYPTFTHVDIRVKKYHKGV